MLYYFWCDVLAIFTVQIFVFLTIAIPGARIGSESIAHQAEGRMAYSLRGQKGERNNYFSKIQLVRPKKNIETKLLSLLKARQNAFQLPLIGFQSLCFSLLGGYNI